MTYYDEDENENSNRKRFLASQKVTQEKEETIDRILKLVFLPIQMLPTMIKLLCSWKDFNKKEKLRLTRLLLGYSFLFFLFFCCFGQSKAITLILTIIYGVSFALKKFDEQENYGDQGLHRISERRHPNRVPQHRARTAGQIASRADRPGAQGAAFRGGDKNLGHQLKSLGLKGMTWEASGVNCVLLNNTFPY